tara:strand:+ start:3744 stop:4715 length:972 start_codon:yes stop_codon:yes gene_type:complete
MTFTVAKREAVPMMIGIAGTSGSGKTYSALLMAAGLAGKEGKVGFIDTELGRGSMYADDIDIIQAMPDSKYYIKNLSEPFTPKKYTDAIKEAIQSGVNVLVIDSMSHEWEGFGGCQDIAENNKLRGFPNWAMAKMEHKKLMNLLTQCPMHIIFCLRAREKTKPVKTNGKIEMVEEGMKEIQEKNFMFDMTLSMLLSEDNPGKPIIKKCPKPLTQLFSGDQSRITKEVGVKLLAWSDGGESIDVKLRNLKRECREAAGHGSTFLDAFFSRIEKEDKALLKAMTTKDFQEEVRSLAKEADELDLNQDEETESKINFNNSTDNNNE